jgi:hypothetical protein
VDEVEKVGPPCPRDIFLGAEHEQSFANITSSHYAAGTRSGIPRSLDSGPALKYLMGSSHVLNSDSDSCDLRIFIVTTPKLSKKSKSPKFLPLDGTCIKGLLF